ncbi:NAD-dependent epimerase/dehydratase family protein [Streptomyces sp. DT9]
MKILVLGATGYAGFHISRALRQEGHTVLGLTRDATSTRSRDLLVEEVRPVEGLMSAPETYRAALEEADAVICAALDMNDPLGSDRLLFRTLREAQERTGRSRHLVFTTGITFLTTSGGVWDEKTPADPGNPLHLRAQAEQDLAAAYVTVLRRPEAFDGEVFMLGDEHQPTLLSVQQACLNAAGYSGDISFESADTGGMLESCADRDELVDSAKARTVLGGQPRHPGILEDTLTYYAAWDRAQPQN